MNAIPLVLALSLGVTTEQIESLTVTMESSPEKLKLGDVLFARLLVRNDGKEPITLDGAYHPVFGNLAIELVDPVASTRFWFAEGGGCGSPGKSVLLPGKTCVAWSGMLAMPKISDVDSVFWHPNRWRNDEYCLSVHLEFGKGIYLQKFGARFRVDRRPKDEMEYLVSVRNTLSKQRGTPANWDWNRPALAHFGYEGLPLEASQPENLKKLDCVLSPGSLRNLVHGTRLAQGVYDAADVDAKREAAVAISSWLDGLPEIERHWFAAHLLTWAGKPRMREDIRYGLAWEMIAKMPAKLGEHSDYRAKWRERYLLEHKDAAPYFERMEKNP